MGPITNQPGKRIPVIINAAVDGKQKNKREAVNMHHLTDIMAF